MEQQVLGIRILFRNNLKIKRILSLFTYSVRGEKKKLVWVINVVNWYKIYIKINELKNISKKLKKKVSALIQKAIEWFIIKKYSAKVEKWNFDMSENNSKYLFRFVNYRTKFFNILTWIKYF